MKDLSIEKLEERNTGNFHLIRKVNELVDAVNDIAKGMQELEKSMYPPAQISVVNRPDETCKRCAAVAHLDMNGLCPKCGDPMDGVATVKE